jgi:phosphatidylinositol glycan class M
MAVLRRELWAAACARAIMLAYGVWHDSHLEPRYTDIDYDVFSDGAQLVWNGRSPFERPTYRYTPLLALMLTPNVWLHPAWGKLIFSTADLIIGLQIYRILRARHVPQLVARQCAWAWMFNPLAINVSTRGNAESLVAVLLLTALHALLRRRVTTAAVLLAMAIHLKPYPVIYVPAFIVSLGADDGLVDEEPIARRTRSGGGSVSATSSPKRRPHLHRQSLLADPRSRFATALVAVLGALMGLCWAWCGDEFVREAALYHLKRTDTRHNLSPYFYALYILPAGSSMQRVLSALAFVPQAILLSAITARFGRDLPFCLSVLTIIFVSFNKVCTVQYFVWYLSLLPLIAPSSAALLPANRAATAAVVGAWLLALASWLWFAYDLEFRGRADAFLPLWLSGLAFLGANTAVASTVIQLHHVTPLFERSSQPLARIRIARQVCLYGTRQCKSYNDQHEYSTKVRET